MKKYFKISFYYALAAMAGGVFYREFTKYMNFTGVTQLGKVHTHLFMLGMFMFLIVGILVKTLPALEKEKKFANFMKLYNTGVIITATMMIVRGVSQVQHLDLTSGANGAISGISGVGHLLLGIGLIFFFQALIHTSEKN